MAIYSTTVSLVTAAFNEEVDIFKTLSSWHIYLENSKDIENFEIVIINDGSTDKTREEILKLSEKSKIHFHEFKKNLGAAAAFNAAIKKSKYNYVLIMDADNQFPIENFKIALNKLLEKNLLAIIGNRKYKKDNLYYALGSKISGKLANLICGTAIPDFNCAFKLVNGELLRSLSLEAKGMNYSTEMTAKILEVTDRVESIDVFHHHTDKKRNFKKILRSSLDRGLFVMYLAIRKIFLKLNIIYHEERK
jgi:dolichol-phosphate mannosyltransferase